MENRLFRKRFKDLGSNVASKIDKIFEGETRTDEEFVSKFKSLSAKARKKAVKIAGAGLVSLLVLCGFAGCVDTDGNIYNLEQVSSAESGNQNILETLTLEDFNFSSLYDVHDAVVPIVQNFEGPIIHRTTDIEYSENFRVGMINGMTEMQVWLIQPAEPEDFDYARIYYYVRGVYNNHVYYFKIDSHLSKELGAGEQVSEDTMNSLLQSKDYNSFVLELSRLMNEIPSDEWKYSNEITVSVTSKYQDELNNNTHQFASFIDPRYVNAQILYIEKNELGLDWFTHTVTGIGYTKDGQCEKFKVNFKYKGAYSVTEEEFIEKYYSGEIERLTCEFYRKLMSGEIEKEDPNWEYFNISTQPIIFASKTNSVPYMDTERVDENEQ